MTRRDASLRHLLKQTPRYTCITITNTTKMTNPLQLSLTNEEGKRKIIIAPVLEKVDKKLHPTGVYKIFKDAVGDESQLFTEPLETLAPNNDVPEHLNPDYLGEIIFDGLSHWTYHGDILSLDEQKQTANYIMKY